jgi:hypothetical protein
MNAMTWDRLGVAITDWNALNSQRTEAFHQLDIRIDKKWFFTKWSIDLFLDVQNVYNQVTSTKPILDVQRDGQGNPIADPANPGQYLPVFLDNTNGSVLPTIGLIIEL